MVLVTVVLVKDKADMTKLYYQKMPTAPSSFGTA